jgi:flagellar motor switch protein FliG
MTYDHQNQDTNAPLTEPMSTLGSVAADLKTAAADKLDQAMTEVRARADGAKAGVASEVGDVATALRRAAEEMRGGSPQERTIGTIASSLADVSDSIRDKDLGEIVQMVSKVARDNPVLFLGGAALLGFAASRYAKASSGHRNANATPQPAYQAS